jgi:hypothetical protein
MINQMREPRLAVPRVRLGARDGEPQIGRHELTTTDETATAQIQMDPGFLNA